MGVVSDEKLLDLLEVALSSDTAETVKKSRELMESGVDPVALMSQLASLIMDIIAGTYRLPKSRSSGSLLLEHSREYATLFISFLLRHVIHPNLSYSSPQNVSYIKWMRKIQLSSSLLCL